ncbi:MAG TPA: adenylate/guanylate cyclase domain-containing protein [Micromonosporaceae bacterium]
MTCPVCGTVAVPGARFCHNCGAALPAAATLPRTERRVVTVLFGDLSDFTAWAEDRDPERVGAVTDRVLAALAGAVKTFGGHVDKLTGDGIMAVFGAPVAHEDDAERAVRAALSMQRAVRRVLDDEQGGGTPLGLRVGLNTGEVVAGVQAALEYTVIGDTVNTAARLADAAAVGTVYAGAGTASSSRRVASWRRLRPLRLKGKREPVEAYELLGLLDAPGTRSGLGDEAPFVGRETELARVASRLAEVTDRGESRVLVITAEAGVGKTRFAAEAARLAAGSSATATRFASAGGARVLSVRSAPYGERRRLGPLADLVHEALGLPTESGTVTRAMVEERLRRLIQRVSRVNPTVPKPNAELLLTLLGLADAPAAAVDTPRGEREAIDVEAIPVAVAHLFSALAAEEPLVVIVDDLHHATPESVEALGVTLNQLTGPVLVMLLGRPELVRPAGALTRLADAEVVNLPPLRGADAARLLSAYLNGGRLPQPDEDRLLATAQGNPFYLAELVTLLIERGALTAGPAQSGERQMWRLAEGSLGGRLLSRDLAAVLAARIDALPADARSTLRDAAVIGDTVPAEAMRALRERRTTRDGRPTAVVAVEAERSLEELLQRRMLRRTRTGYAFATPLMREAAYAGIGKADLADRHAYLVRWAAPETRGPKSGPTGMSDEAVDVFVASHAERAVALADAVGLRPEVDARAVAPLGVAALGRLARRALAAGEPTIVVRYIERSAQLAGAALPARDQLVHARALLQLGRPTDALTDVEKTLANVGTNDVATRASALLIAGRAYQLLGDRDRAVASWQEALVASTEAGLPAEQAEAQRRMGMADYLSGRLAEAGERFTSAYQVAVEAGDKRSQAWSLQNLAWVTTTRGDFDGSNAALGRAARLFAQQRDPAGRAWLRGTCAFARMLAGRLTEARRMARVFLPFGERVGEQWAVGTLRAVDAFAAAELGELAEADREARRAYRDFAVASDDWGRGFALVVRGVIARGLAEPDHAYDLLSDALQYSEPTGHPLLIGMARTIRGFVELERGNAEAALVDARKTLDIVEPHNVLEAAEVGPRALAASARLALGEPDVAYRLLEPVVAATGPSLLFPRRQGVAYYAAALLDSGRPEEALDWAYKAVEWPAEDVRSLVVARRQLARALAAVGRHDDARAVAEQAVHAAYSTEQVAERTPSEELLTSLGGAPMTSGRHDPTGT